MSISKLGNLPESKRKVIRAWCMYDWANSSFATSGVAAIFPVYFVFLFKDAFGEQEIFLGITFTGSSLWSLGIALSTAIVALSSPILGVIADRIPIKKTLLCVYTIAGSLFTMLVFISAYTPWPWAWVFGSFLLANIGFAGSLVFYNSFLPHIAPKELLDDVSSRGFAYGYVGGGLLLVIHLILITVSEGSEISDLVTRLSIGSIGIWWFGWALWTLRVIPEPPIINRIQGLSILQISRLGAKELITTFKELKKFKVLLLYLGAYLLFNDGIQTVMGVAGAFAADTLGIPLTFNMATILIIQFVAAGGAIVFAKLATLLTTKNALMIALSGWVIMVMFGVGIAPLIPSLHTLHDYQLNYASDKNIYIVTSSPELGDSENEKHWNKVSGGLENDSKLSLRKAETFVNTVSEFADSKYSISIAGGPLDNMNAIGQLHPSVLGEGTLDWWPVMVRKFIWQPLGLQVGYQWLILGVGVGLVMGGSQALARSLFAKISPETRSGEFFSFFGFMSRASSVFGPMLYVLITGILDTRAAVFSIIVIIVMGGIILKWVNVEEGSRIAEIEDQKIKSEFKIPS